MIATPVRLEHHQLSNVLNVLFRSGPLTLRIVEDSAGENHSFGRCLSVETGAAGDALDCTSVAMDYVEIGGGTGPCRLDLSSGGTLLLPDGWYIFGPPVLIESMMCEGQLH